MTMLNDMGKALRCCPNYAHPWPCGLCFPRMTRYDRYHALGKALRRCDWYGERWGRLLKAWDRVGGLIYPDA